MPTPRILAFSGSAREASLNRKLLHIVVNGARNAGAEVTVAEMRDYPMPLYDGDLEARSGLPENTKKFRALMLQHQGLLLACPEFNSSVTPLFKNTLDWCSRPSLGEKPLACFTGKVAGLVAASPGALGGLRGLVHARAILSNIGVLVVPEQRTLPKAQEAFMDDGQMKDDKLREGFEEIGARVAHILAKLSA